MRKKTPHPIRVWRLMNGGERLAQTAKRLGISESYLSLLETGKRRISLEMAVKIEKKLGIPVLEVWGGR